jgi:hypothetical protein
MYFTYIYVQLANMLCSNSPYDQFIGPGKEGSGKGERGRIGDD